MFKHEKSESSHLISTSKDKGKKRKKDEVVKGSDQKKPKKNEDFFFCKKPGHVTKRMYKISRLVC